MHLMRESWTDARLDDFRADVDRRFDEVYRRFDEVDKRFDKVEGEIRELRSEMKSGFETIHRTMVQGIVALSASFIAGFAAIVGLVATQL
jgi:tetrahydromethanopterin S-methyltransferase subunit G